MIGNEQACNTPVLFPSKVCERNPLQLQHRQYGQEERHRERATHQLAVDRCLRLALEPMLVEPSRQFGIGDAAPLQLGLEVSAHPVRRVQVRKRGAGFIINRVDRDTRIIADEAGGWNDLQARFDMARIDHSKLFSDRSGVYSNGAESFFSRMRRAEIGHHHHIAGQYLVRYAQGSAWREDHRRVANGVQVKAVATLAMAAPVSVDWCGYWLRAIRKAA